MCLARLSQLWLGEQMSRFPVTVPNFSSIFKVPTYLEKNHVLSRFSNFFYNWVIRARSSSVLSHDNSLIKGNQAHKTKLLYNLNSLSFNLQ